MERTCLATTNGHRGGFRDWPRTVAGGVARSGASGRLHFTASEFNTTLEQLAVAGHHIVMAPPWDPHSARSKAFRYLLRDIDWAIECGSQRWTDGDQRDAAWTDFDNAGVAWKSGGRAGAASPVRHDKKTLTTLPWQFLAAFGRGAKTRQTLYEKGSGAASPGALRKLQYSRELEVSKSSRGRHPQRLILS